MVGNRASKKKMQVLEILAIFFKAWIAYRDSKPLELLRWAPGANESFPDISMERRNAVRPASRNGRA